MDKKTWFAIATLVILGAAYAVYEYWQHNHQQTEITQVRNTPPPLPPPTPAASEVVETRPVQPPLPPLAKSDSMVSDALATLVADPLLVKLFHTKLLIHDIVATVDNLPRQRVPAKLMPFAPPSGNFLAVGSEGHLIISPKNANRYASYVKLAEVVDAKKLVGLYVRLYPLFQQAYEELGYPNINFNDQLNDTIDDLLDTPDIKDPIKLVQPKYFYLYADPNIEALSIGEKIMLRLGNNNMKAVKAKLAEIKQELALHANELNTE
jgi:Protein of unknown function (DUF3014)